MNQVSKRQKDPKKKDYLELNKKPLVILMIVYNNILDILWTVIINEEKAKTFPYKAWHHDITKIK